MKQIIVTVIMAVLVTGCATQDKAPASTGENIKAQPNGSDSGDIRALMAMLGGSEPLSQSQLAAIAKEVSVYPLGSKSNPVRANMPTGQQAYLNSLRCEDGNPPKYSRAGSAGLSPYQSIQDVYVVTCANSAPAETLIYIDMYHPQHLETEPVAGFTIAQPE